MIRPSRLQRRLDAALAPVVDSIDSLTESVDAVRYGAVSTVAAKVADAERRVTAATAQAGERVAHAERRAADAIAAVQAELADERIGKVETVAEWQRRCERTEYERDAARFNADTAHAAEAAWKESWWQLKAEHDAVLAQRDAMADLLARAVPKVAAKTTRARYLAELAALTAPPCDEPDLADSA